MGAKAQESRNYNNVPMIYFQEQCRRINDAGLNLSLQSENPNDDGNGVWFRIIHGATMSSWGEKITITLKNTGSGTNVHILSACGMPTQIVDYGKNKKNVKVIFNYLEHDIRNAARYQQAAPQTASAQQAAPARQEAPQDAAYQAAPVQQASAYQAAPAAPPQQEAPQDAAYQAAPPQQEAPQDAAYQTAPAQQAAPAQQKKPIPRTEFVKPEGPMAHSRMDVRPQNPTGQREFVFCTSCGQKNVGFAKFCCSCGKKIVIPNE